MKCIAIDDEPVALLIIKEYCNRCNDIKLSTYTDPIAGMEKVLENKPDILFLDIEMGGINGVDIARNIPDGVFLVFTTAYAEYAVDGFELNAIDYLYKPFSFSRFEKALEKVRRMKKLERLSAEPAISTEDEITLKVEYKNVNVKIASVEYIEAMDNYIKVYLTDEKNVLSQTSMKAVMEMLPPDKFMRVHKSYIVPIHKVDNYNRRQLTLYHRGVKIPVGRVYAENFIRRMTDNITF